MDECSQLVARAQCGVSSLINEIGKLLERLIFLCHLLHVCEHSKVIVEDFLRAFIKRCAVILENLSLSMCALSKEFGKQVIKCFD